MFFVTKTSNYRNPFSSGLVLELVAARLYVDAQRSRRSDRQPLGGVSMRLHEWQALDSVVSSA